MVQIDLNTEIYSEESVRQAIQAYHDYASISTGSKSGYIVVIFSECRYDEQMSIKEFENYLIGVENSR